ncbi:MAG: diacylglycerol kinase family protein [Sphingomicrobium sp.]
MRILFRLFPRSRWAQVRGLQHRSADCGRLIAPKRPDPSGTNLRAPESPAKAVQILVNRGGGAASAAGDKLRDELAAAVEAHGVNGKIEFADGGDISKRAEDAAKAGEPLLVVGGGDGSISAAAGALAGTDTVLGLLPLGTLNHLSRDLGVPAKLDQAVAVIAAGQQRRIDVAEVNGRVFVNNAAIGLYPLMVLDREAQQHRLGRSKRLAMLVAVLRALIRFRHHRLSLTVNEQDQATLDTPLLFVGNNEYSLELPNAGTRAALDDGRLCVMVMRKKGRAGLIAATLRVLIGRVRNDDMIRLDDVTRLRVASRRSHLTLAIDGETLSVETPLDFRIRPGALTVIVPADEPSAA